MPYTHRVWTKAGSLWRRFVHLSAPPAGSVADLRQELFEAAVRIALVFGALPVALGVYRSVEAARWLLTGMYAFFYLGIVLLSLSRSLLDYRVRLRLAWLHIFLIANISLVVFGLSGAGFLLHMLLAALTSVMFGMRIGLASGLVSGLSCLLLGLGVSSGVLPALSDFRLDSTSPASWLQMTLVFTAPTGLVVLAPGLLVRRIERALQDEQEKAAALQESNEGLRRAMAERSHAEASLDAVEAAYRHAQKMESIGRLTGSIVHDFNNLLTAISGNLDYARLDLRPGDAMEEVCDELEEATERAAALTRQLLAFSRRETDPPTTVDLNVLASSLRKMLDRLLGEDVSLVLSTCDEPALVLAHPGQLEQVIMNLAVNARDAMSEGGRLIITISVREQAGVDDVAGGAVRLRVSDEGPGIAPEIRAQIFEPFFTTKVQGEGTGLGLATVRDIVTHHGGTVSVSSDPGRGAAFTIELPRLRGESRTTDAVPTGDVEEVVEASVLVVEDERLVRDVAVRSLRRMGYTVHVATSVQEAGALLDGPEIHVDLLVTDLILTDGDGATLAEQAGQRRPELCVLYTSGYPAETVSRHGVDVEGSGFLAKPYTPEGLSRQVRRCLQAGPPDPARGVRESPVAR